MSNKKIFFILVLFLMISLVSNVSAITASLGNSRMILKLNIGDREHRTILVRNVNDVPIDIEMFSAGDLKDDISIEDANFTLDVGEEKKVGIDIFVSKGGTTETKVNVKFKDKNGGGVGLTSTIMVVAPEGKDIVDLEYKKDKGVTNNKDINYSVNDKSPNIFLFSGLTAVLALVFIVLLVFTKKGNRKGVRGVHV